MFNKFPLKGKRVVAIVSGGGSDDVMDAISQNVDLFITGEFAHEHFHFAKEAGIQAAKQGYTLVSGNAAGADQAAQQACLEAGGSVISVVATELEKLEAEPRVLYLAEDGFDHPFSAQRALSRNRVIHSLGEKTLAAQCSLEKGGTWDGCVRNLRFHWSPVFCFADGTKAVERLLDMGAEAVGMEALSGIGALRGYDRSFLDE